MNEYGTFLYAETEGGSAYRLQSDNKRIVKEMRKRCKDPKSPWKVTGWGTSWIFRRDFKCEEHALHSCLQLLSDAVQEARRVNRYDETTFILKPCI